MSRHRQRPHLICYDIADPKRLGKVHRYLKKTGLPLQYSVFLVNANAEGIARIRAALAHIIDPARDDIRIYPLPARPAWQLWGSPRWPEGLFAGDMPLPVDRDVLD